MKPAQKAIVDTNILLGWVATLTSPRAIGQWKGLTHLTDEEVRGIMDLAFLADRVLVTPHVLAECSNLMASFPARERRGAYLALLALLETNLAECFVAADKVLRDELAGLLGLTDCGILALADDETIILSNDSELGQHARSRGFTVIGNAES